MKVDTFKVNKNDTRTTSMKSLWFLYCLLLPLFCCFHCWLSVSKCQLGSIRHSRSVYKTFWFTTNKLGNYFCANSLFQKDLCCHFGQKLTSVSKLKFSFPLWFFPFKRFVRSFIHKHVNLEDIFAPTKAFIEFKCTRNYIDLGFTKYPLSATKWQRSD